MAAAKSLRTKAVKAPLEKKVGLLIRNLSDLLIQRGIPNSPLQISPGELIAKARAHADPIAIIAVRALVIALWARHVYKNPHYARVLRDKTVAAAEPVAALHNDERLLDVIMKQPSDDSFAERRQAVAALIDDTALKAVLERIKEARSILNLATQELFRHAEEHRKNELLLFGSPAVQQYRRWMHAQQRQSGRLRRAWQRWVRRGRNTNRYTVPTCFRLWQKARVIQPPLPAALEFLLGKKSRWHKPRVLPANQLQEIRRHWPHNTGAGDVAGGFEIPRRRICIRLRQPARPPLRWRYSVVHEQIISGLLAPASQPSLLDKLARHAEHTHELCQDLEAHAKAVAGYYPNIPRLPSEWDDFSFTVGADFVKAGMSMDDVIRLLSGPGEDFEDAKKRITLSVKRRQRD